MVELFPLYMCLSVCIFFPSARDGEGPQRCLAIWGTSHRGGCARLPWHHQGKTGSFEGYTKIVWKICLLNWSIIFKNEKPSNHFWNSWCKLTLTLCWQRPMDLATIEKKLTNRAYRTKNRFVQDLNLMLDNCRLYNGENSGR